MNDSFEFRLLNEFQRDFPLCAAPFAELAVRNRRAVPLVAALATRRVLGPAAARMPQQARVQAVRTVRNAANQH